MRSMPLIVILLTLLTGCKPGQKFEDQEIKGLLTTDKSAMGNDYLEVNDIESNQTRFIHPGKKIITIEHSWGTAKIRILDGRRVQLASIQANLEGTTLTNEKLFISSQHLKQDWDFLATRRKFSLRTEFYPTRYSKSCDNEKGLTGVVWRVFDYRNDYDIKFLVPGTDKVWGQLIATGEHKTETERFELKKCLLTKTVHNEAKEFYQ